MGDEGRRRLDGRGSGGCIEGEKQVPTPKGPDRPGGCRPAQVDRYDRPPREEGRQEHQDLRRRHLLVVKTDNARHAGLWPCASR